MFFIARARRGEESGTSYMSCPVKFLYGEQVKDKEPRRNGFGQGHTVMQADRRSVAMARIDNHHQNQNRYSQPEAESHTFVCCFNRTGNISIMKQEELRVVPRYMSLYEMGIFIPSPI